MTMTIPKGKAVSSAPVAMTTATGAPVEMGAELAALESTAKIMTAAASQAAGLEMGGIAGLFAAIDNVARHGHVEKDTAVAMAASTVVGQVVQSFGEGPATTAQGPAAPNVGGRSKS